MNYRFPLLLLVFIVLISPISVSAYDMNFIMQDDGSTDHIVISPSVYWDRNCNVSITLFANASHAGSYTLNNKWFSPDTSQVLFGNPSYTSNIVCLNQGTGTSTTSLNDFYESRTTTQTSATTTYTWVNVTYDCEFDSDMMFIYDKTNITDSFGNFPFAYGKIFETYCGIAPTSSTWIVNDTVNYLKAGYYAECGADLDVDIAGVSTTCSGGGVAYDYGMVYATMTPFNSMSSGIVNLSVIKQEIITTGGGSCTGGTLTSTIYLWDTVTDSTTILSASIPYSANLNLIPDRDYWLFIKSHRHDQRAFGDSCTITYYHTDYNMTIFAYEPTWICDDWSDCTQGVQYRTCIDADGIAPSRVETRGCIDIPFYEALLGFEEYYTDSVYICQKYWYLTCQDYLSVINVKYPVNWTVSSTKDASGYIRENFVEVSPDTSTEGTQSLKMWYIPMKPEDPIPDPTNSSLTICGNLTQGRFPEVNTPYNQTLFVSANITFPSSFMDLRFDIRKCPDPVQQYDYTGDLLGFNCGERCYAYNCNQTPLGRYGVRLIDANTNDILFDYFDDATDNWKSYVADLSDVGLQAGHNYTIGVAVNPENVFDAYTHCIYVDNFRATVRIAEVPCESYCDGFTYYSARRIDNACVYTIEEVSTKCVDPNDAPEVEEYEDWCDDTTLYTFNDVTGKWETIEDAPECIAEQEAAEEEEEMTQPISSTSEGIELFSFLWAPITLFFIFSLLISGILMATISRMSQTNPSWQVFGISMLCWMLIGTIFLIIPIWIGIVIVAAVSLMIAKELRGYSFGGG